MEAKEKLAKKTAADAKKKEKAAAKVPCDNAATSVDWSCPFLSWQAHFPSHGLQSVVILQTPSKMNGLARCNVASRMLCCCNYL